MVTPTQLPVLSFLSTFPLFHHVTWLLSSFQECWRLTASRDPWCLSAPHQSSPPPLSSNIRWSNSYTGPRGPGKTSSPWQHRATWLQARTVAAGAWGTTQRLLTHKKNYICKRQPCNGTPGVPYVFHFFPLQGSCVGLWIWELRKLPSVLAGGAVCTAAVMWRLVHLLTVSLRSDCVWWFGLALCIPGRVLCVMLQGRVPVSQSNLVLVQVCKIEAWWYFL